MSLTEISLNIPTEHVANVFGQFDAYIKKIERTLNVTVVVRGDSMKLIGNERQIKSASNVFMQLLELSKRGNVITEQNVNYALSLAAEAKESAIVEIDKDCICHTINGKPVKPKTLGQKNYVDAIRQKMIVFGMGPAGTGKTYLAMAMAITAFKNEEVGRIILTRPAIEAGEKLGFLPGDLQSKVDPYLRPLYDALYQIMGAESFQKMFLTRIGFGSKAVITGDATQKDLSPGTTSGLDVALKVLKKVDEIGICELTSQDVVRHPVVQKIVKAYEDYENRNKKKPAEQKKKWEKR